VTSPRSLHFGPFELDLRAERLLRKGRPLRVRPKALAVLAHLAEHREQLVTREELLEAVWPGVTVSPATLNDCVREVRQVLSDDAARPRYLETVPRRGYRFVAKLDAGATGPPADAAPLVGREAALAGLQRAFDRALAGQHQIVWVRGEAGIGKTTLVDAFLAALPRSAKARVARSQCLETVGGEEAFGPVLEAVAGLCRGPGGDPEARAVEVLRRLAPSWLAQLPSLLKGREYEQLVGAGAGPREPLLRELKDALVELGRRGPLVVVLEDVHWSDPSTLDAIGAIARMREPLPLLLLASTRPPAEGGEQTPLAALRAELGPRDDVHEIELPWLSEEEVAEWLALESSGRPEQDARELAAWLAARSGGNPLFVAGLLDSLQQAGALRLGPEGAQLQRPLAEFERDVPSELRDLIARQLARLDPELQRCLEAASVEGADFTSEMVATLLDTKPGSVEDRCEPLVREARILRAGPVEEWPDGTLTARYGFVHALYRDVLYERTSAARRARWHRRLAERLEASFPDGAVPDDQLSTMALHLEQAGLPQRALPYRRRCVEVASRRCAGEEAQRHAERALALLAELPEATRASEELAIRSGVAPALAAARSLAHPDVEAHLTRAVELARELDDPRLPRLLWVLARRDSIQSRWTAVEHCAGEIEAYARTHDDAQAELLAQETFLQCDWTFCRFDAVFERCARCLELYQDERDGELLAVLGQDPRINCLMLRAFCEVNLVRSAAAHASATEALELARRSGHPHTHAQTQLFAAMIAALVPGDDGGRAQAEESVALARRHDLLLLEALSRLVRVVTGPFDEAAAQELGEAGQQIEQAGEGATQGGPFFLNMLAAYLVEVGLGPVALPMLDEAERAAEAEGTRHHLAFTLLVRARLASDDAEKEELLRRGLAIAEERGALASALRCGEALAELLIAWGRGDEARALLAPIVARIDPAEPLAADARRLLAV